VARSSFKDQAAFQVHMTADHANVWRAACKEYLA